MQFDVLQPAAILAVLWPPCDLARGLLWLVDSGGWLQLLSELLADKALLPVLQSYLDDPANLKLVMTLLKVSQQLKAAPPCA